MDLSPDAWQAIGTVAGGVVATIGAVVIAHVKTSRSIEGVKQTADYAVELSKPTGNGFAGKTLGSLERVESLLGELKDDQRRTSDLLVRHLEAHVAGGLQEPRWAKINTEAGEHTQASNGRG